MNQPQHAVRIMKRPAHPTNFLTKNTKFERREVFSADYVPLLIYSLNVPGQPGTAGPAVQAETVTGTGAPCEWNGGNLSMSDGTSLAIETNDIYSSTENVTLSPELIATFSWCIADAGLMRWMDHMLLVYATARSIRFAAGALKAEIADESMHQQ
jgi:hypothetical protein